MFEKNSLTIGRRLALGFGLVLSLMIGVTVFGILKVRFIDRTLTEITDVNAVKQRYAINFRGSVHDRAIALRDVALLQDATELRAAQDEIDKLAVFYKESASALDQIFSSDQGVTDRERTLLADIKASEAETLPLIQQVIQARLTDQQAISQEVLLKQARPALQHWLKRINLFIDDQEKLNQQATAAARQAAGQFAILMLSLCSLAILIGSSIAYQISSYLGRSLGGEPNTAAMVVSRIAGGDLSSPVDVTHAGSMLAAVAGMQDQLRALFTGIVRASVELSIKAEKLGEATREARDAAASQAQVSASSAASIEEMTRSIDDVSRIARLTEENSAKTTELAEEGAKLVETAAEEMDRVAQTVSASSEQISSLQQRSEEIGSIAGVIREIADQTNLLALNAAIEAARAGETGRGFAVVADEVRKLAERTGAATSEIARMIEVIQNETQHSVMAMQTAVPKVQQGLSLAREATRMLGEIQRQAADSLSNVRHVARATEQQASTALLLGQHVEQIAATSDKTSRAMQGNAAAVTDLEGISTALKQQVSVFKLQS